MNTSPTRPVKKPAAETAARAEPLLRREPSGARKPLPWWTLAAGAAMALVIVAIELGAISYIRHRYMDTPFLQAAFQVIVGGVLVFLTGWLIGSS